MPQQLIYTSSPRGLVAGRSGYCTVACSQGMREALQLRLEQISYFEHLDAAGARQPSVCAYRTLDIRGSRFHVLSRIVDAGLDFTKRTNFIAHHLVFQPQEILNLPAPPILFLHWNGWRDNWQGEPQYLTNENWGNLMALGGNNYNPASNWAALTGDAVNAVALLDSRPQESFVVDGMDEKRTLPLIAESLAILAIRPGSSSSLWQQSFTTFLQERDEMADFRWRLLYSGTPAHDRLISRSAIIKPLSEIRCVQCDEITATFTRSGPQPLQITQQPENRSLSDGQELQLKVVAIGVPPASRFQWYLCSREGKRQQPISGANSAELRLTGLPLGVSRYQVVVENGCGGSVESQVAVISIEKGATRSESFVHQPNSPVALKRASGTTSLVKPIGKKVEVSIDTSPDDNWPEAELEVEVAEKNYTKLFICLAGVVFIILVGFLGIQMFKTGDKANSNTQPSTALIASNMVASIPPKLPDTITPVVNQNQRNNYKGFLYFLQPPASEKNLSALTNELEAIKLKIQKQKADNFEFTKKTEAKLKDLNDALVKADQKIEGLVSRPENNQSQPNGKPKSGKKGDNTAQTSDSNPELNKARQERDQISNGIQALKSESVGETERRRLISLALINQQTIQNSKINQEKNRDDFRNSENQRLTQKMRDLCTVSNNQSIYYDFNDYSKPNQKKIKELEFNQSSIKIDATVGGELILGREAGQFSIQRFDEAQAIKPLLMPYSISFYSDPSPNRVGDLIIWPLFNSVTLDARCDNRGNISILGATDLLQLLSRLDNNDHDFETHVTYLANSDGGCSNSFPGIKTDFNFADLNQVLQKNKADISAWTNQQNSAEKFFEFRKQPPQPPITDYSADPFFDELNKLCIKKTGGDVGNISGPRLFDFENSDDNTLKADCERLSGALFNKNIGPPLFNENDCQNIILFLRNHQECKTLDSIQIRLNELIPQGRLDLSKLNAWIVLKRKEVPGDTVLVTLRFTSDKTTE